jgi:hypothetical protein
MVFIWAFGLFLLGRVVAGPRSGYLLATATFSITAATSDDHWLFIPALVTCLAGLAAPNEFKQHRANDYDHAPPTQSTILTIDRAANHPGLTLPLETLELAVTARHPGERILARYPAHILAHGEEPLHVGEVALGSTRIHWTSYTTSGLGVAGGLALELAAIIAIRSHQCDLEVYLDQNVVDQDGLATRFSFRVEPDNSALADFFTKFALEYRRATGRAFRNLDDEQLARVLVLDWSEQISMQH